MAREIIDPPVKERTTVVTNKILLDRVYSHVRKNDTNLTDFVTKALVNQLEREGDLTIRSEMEEVNND